MLTKKLRRNLYSNVRSAVGVGRKYNVVDDHVLEPPNFWQEYIDPRCRGRAPELFAHRDGRERLRVEDKVLGCPIGLGFIGAIGTTG